MKQQDLTYQDFISFQSRAMVLVDQQMKTSLLSALPQHSFKNVCLYALFPAGKYFRPLLAEFFLRDLLSQQELTPLSPSFQAWQRFLEVHHTYTLVHDDLPCMDNDDLRRGRAATHKQFGETQALLAGDALLNLSYQCLSLCPHEVIPMLLKISTWALGAKGIILGQVLDCQQEKIQHFSEILRIHELKTSRLLQVALIGSYLLHSPSQGKTLSFVKLKELLRLGKYLGYLFQFLDDYQDISQAGPTGLSLHEQSINPFIHFPQESFHILIQSLTFTSQYLKQKEMILTRFYIKYYLDQQTSSLKHSTILNPQSMKHLLEIIQTF
jgi:geranylgeranyl diphosphate synthase type II